MKHLVVLGISHDQNSMAELSDANLREELPDRLSELRAKGGVAGYVLLATCNRIEAYIDLGHTGAVDSTALFGDLRCRELRGTAAARHLIRVAASLESMVLGENQILGQVRQALATAREAKTVTPLLLDVVQGAIAGGRKVRKATGLGSQPVSVASLAVHHLLERLPSQGECRIAVIGAGIMARKAAAGLAARRGLRLLFVNRTESRAAELADDFGGASIGLGDFLAEPPAVDAVFVAASAPEPLIDGDVLTRLQEARTDRCAPMLVDVCVPAGVDPALERQPGVVLIGMTELKRASAANVHAREAAAEAALPIVESQLDRMTACIDRAAPGLDAVRAAHVELGETELVELERGFPDLSARDLDRLRRFIAHAAKAHAHLHLKDLQLRMAPALAS